MKNVLILILVANLNLGAQTIEFLDLSYQGTGCPAGTLTSILSPDGKSLSLLYDQFMVEVPSTSQAPVQLPSRSNPRGPSYNPRGPAPRAIQNVFEDHKTCHLKLSTILEENTYADEIEISLNARGVTFFDQGIEGYFSTILVGYSGLARSRTASTSLVDLKLWRNPLESIEDEWVATPTKSFPINSSCARGGNKTINFELKNHLNAKIMDRDIRKSGSIIVDSHDLNGMVKITLKTKKCGTTMTPRRI